MQLLAQASHPARATLRVKKLCKNSSLFVAESSTATWPLTCKAIDKVVTMRLSAYVVFLARAGGC